MLDQREEGGDAVDDAEEVGVHCFVEGGGVGVGEGCGEGEAGVEG